MPLTTKQQDAALKVAAGRERDPAIAAAAGVSVRTLYRWKKDPAFQTAVTAAQERYARHLEKIEDAKEEADLAQLEVLDREIGYREPRRRRP